MSEPETIYSSSWKPDVTNALDVLAFLLVPASAFCEDTDTAATRSVIHYELKAAKMDALLEWYASAMGNKP